MDLFVILTRHVCELLSLDAFGSPGLEGALHVGVCKECKAKFVFDGANDFGVHVGAGGDLGGGDEDLAAEAVGVGNGGTVDDAVEAGPERVGHAHGAGLACGVHGVALERGALELLAGEADGADLGMGAGVVLLANGVEGAHEASAGFRVENVRSKRDGAVSGEGASGPVGDGDHALGVERGLLGGCKA